MDDVFKIEMRTSIDMISDIDIENYVIEVGLDVGNVLLTHKSGHLHFASETAF